MNEQCKRTFFLGKLISAENYSNGLSKRPFCIGFPGSLFRNRIIRKTVSDKYDRIRMYTTDCLMTGSVCTWLTVSDKYDRIRVYSADSLMTGSVCTQQTVS